MTRNRAQQQVPFYGSDREFSHLRAEIMETVEAVLATGRVLQGPAVGELEGGFARSVTRHQGVAVSSCTDALYFCLLALGVRSGDEVLVTDFSFVASASGILRCGATPVFVDIDPATFNMDLAAAPGLVTERTKALIFVHLFGQMADPNPIEAFARYYGLALIEDAAQAVGASFRERRAGSMGDASCFSFDPTKPLAAPGSGGIVVTDREDLAEEIRMLRCHGRAPDGTFRRVGGNSRLPTLAAAVLQLKLGRLDEWTQRRRTIADRYTAAIEETGVVQSPQVAPGSHHIFHKYVLRSSSRDVLRDHLARSGIETMIHYASPLHTQPLFEHLEPVVDNPVAERASKQVLSLPIHPFLSMQEVDRVVNGLHSYAVAG